MGNRNKGKNKGTPISVKNSKRVGDSLASIKGLAEELNENSKLSSLMETPKTSSLLDLMLVDEPIVKPAEAKLHVTHKKVTKLEQLEEAKAHPKASDNRIHGIIIDINRFDNNNQVNYIKIAATKDGKADVYMGHHKNYTPELGAKFKINQLITFVPKSILRDNKYIKSAFNIIIQPVDVSSLITGAMNSYDTNVGSPIVVYSDKQTKGLLANYVLECKTFSDIIARIEKDLKLKFLSKTADAVPKYCFIKQ